MFTILNRKAAGSDKCPRCSRLNVDFVDMGEGVLGCFDCGSVFLKKSERVRSKFQEKKGISVILGPAGISSVLADHISAARGPSDVILVAQVPGGETVNQKKVVKKKKKPRRALPIKTAVVK